MRCNSLLPRLLSLRRKPNSTIYYHGLYSGTILIARTSLTLWETPRGPEEYLKPKKLRIVRTHEIEDIWEDNVAPKVHAILDALEIEWFSIDVVRIGYEEELSGDTILWIGVRSGSIRFDVAIDAALQCNSASARSWYQRY
jgi:hypothetical protein